MLEKRTPIPVGEAVKKVMGYTRVGQTEYISIDESYGRYLAEELSSNK